MNKLKGIVLVVISALASIMMPFSIYAAGETQIVPTYTSSTTQQEWQTKIRVTNYCEGTNASTASCQLQFYVTGNYYGIIYIDGYDSSGTHWMNGTSIFVSGGYGVYNYNFYQNGIKAISSVSIWAVSLFEPDSNVDLTQIIQLLTSINNYENRNNVLLDVIDDNTLNTVNEIKNVISQLVISNGYLDTLTKLHDWNFPIESLGFIYEFKNKDILGIKNYNYYNYPIFEFKNGDLFRGMWQTTNSDSLINVVIFGINKNIPNYNSLLNYVSISNINLIKFDGILRNDFVNLFTIVRLEFYTADSSSNYVTFTSSRDDNVIMPIYKNYKTNEFLSTDFALIYGLNNRLLDDLDIIANGTTASNNASQQLDSDTSDFNTDRDDLIDIEDSMGNNMDSAMNQITPNNNGLSGFGGNFLTSAVWVRTQFDRLTNNTPYGSLIVYGMTLGLALLLLGKVLL